MTAVCQKNEAILRAKWAGEKRLITFSKMGFEVDKQFSVTSMRLTSFESCYL